MKQDHGKRFKILTSLALSLPETRREDNFSWRGEDNTPVFKVGYDGKRPISLQIVGSFTVITPTGSHELEREFA